MKQAALILALTVAAASASASNYDDEMIKLVARLFDSQSTKTSTDLRTSSGPTGRGGNGTGGRTGRSGRATGPRAGNQRMGNSGGGKIGTQIADSRGAMGMTTGSSNGGSVNGNINMGAPYQFGGGMFDKGAGPGATISGPSIGNVGQADSSMSGSNYGSTGATTNANGGAQGGSSNASGSATSSSGNAGGGLGGSSGASKNGGGTANTKGGDNKDSTDLAFSPTLSVPIPAKRDLESLHRRALELEDEYAWVLQQKRDLEESLFAREPEADFFDGEDFEELSARDLIEYYYLMASDY